MINGTRAEEGMSEEPMNEPSRKARPGMLFRCKQPESACGNKLKIEVAKFSPKGRTRREKIDGCIWEGHKCAGSYGSRYDGEHIVDPEPYPKLLVRRSLRWRPVQSTVRKRGKKVK